MAPVPPSPRQPPPRRRAFGRDPVSVRSAREFTRAALLDWGISDRCDDVRLCVSELATNALVHGGEGAHGFLLAITATGHLLRVEVHDAGPGLPQCRMPGDDSDDGRGLLLVSEYADDWGVERSGELKVVWAEFKVVPEPPRR
ncbi:ATP-binding protein [Streptomyces sp. NPDC020719]|uniref:ATP-binding protein n=1 Tax=Streptomyces sp. NPDC020719 TaxID=3154896 RepID=UPI0033E29D47